MIFNIAIRICYGCTAIIYANAGVISIVTTIIAVSKIVVIFFTDILPFISLYLKQTTFIKLNLISPLFLMLFFLISFQLTVLFSCS